MTFFFYNPNVKLNRHGKYNDQDANLYWCKHTKILLALKRIHADSTDFTSRARAREEMTIAEGKIKFWQSRSNFDLQLATQAMSVIRAEMRMAA